MASSAMILCPARPESSAPRMQRRRGRNGWPLAEAESAQIPEADRRAIKSAIAEWGGRANTPRPPGK